jgi:alpha-1,3-glucosyltransferase
LKFVLAICRIVLIVFFLDTAADRQIHTNASSFSLVNFIKLGVTVVAVFAISLGPFAYMGQIPQLLSRLFPFTRGLCHAYWAPNFWALYAGADRVLIIIGKKLGWSLNRDALGSMTRGFVGDTKFAALPQVEAIHTLVITIIAQLVCLSLVHCCMFWLY